MRGYPKRGEIDVLFVSYGGGHVQMVVPVARKLQARGVRVCIFALTTAIAVVESSGLPFFSYADLPKNSDPAVRAIGVRLAKDLPPGGALPYTETEAYLGINYDELQSVLGPDKAAEVWANGGRQHFHPVRTMMDVLDHVRPRLVVTTNSPRSEKAAIEAATSLGIAAVTMVDMFALQEISWLARPDFGRHLYVLDESVKTRMVTAGRPANEVTVTGNPAFDGLFDPVVIASGNAMREARGWGREDRVTILSASTPEPAFHPFTGERADPALPRAVEDRLKSLVAADPRLELVIRRHPSEDQDVAVGGRIHASQRADDINSLIHAVDLVVVTVSTVGLQAHLAGVPVLSVEGSVFTKDAPYGDFGMATPVRNVEEIGPAIETLLPHLARSGKGASAISAEPAADRLATELQSWLICR